MSYWGGVWSSLKYSISSTTDSFFRTNLRYRYIVKEDGALVYKNNRDNRPIIARVLTQKGFQIAEAELHKALPRYRKHIENKLRKKVIETISKNEKVLIDARKKVDEGLGSIVLEGGKMVEALNAYGEKVTDALFLYYDTPNSISVSIPTSNRGNDGKIIYDTVNTKTLFFCDVSPEVNQSTQKNILLTKVQGRDFTRKELISGGDIHFTVKGSINSNMEGVYPENDVKKFIQIMQHGGIIKANHLLFKQFNVTNIIIQDFKLEAQVYKNIQPYSFSCVAVEPDENVIVSSDTIHVVDNLIAEQDLSNWEKIMLGYKLSQITGKNPEFDAMTSMIPDLLDNFI